LAFEILLWIIFIPKTLFKIIWNPSWVPKYVDEELAKEKDRFSEYLSPMLLLSIIIVGMVGAIQWINTLSGVETVIPATALVGEETVLYARPKFLWSDSFVFSQWVIINYNKEPVDHFIRYNFDLSNPDDPYTSKFNNFLKEFDDEIKININKEEYFDPFRGEIADFSDPTENYVSTASEITYSWKKPGIYDVVVFFFGNNGGMVTSSVYRVFVSEPSKLFTPLPFFENNVSTILGFKGSFNNLFFNGLFSESIFKNRDFAVGTVLFSLLLPLFLALVGHALEGGSLSRFGLQRHLYIQALYFAPLIFSVLISVFTYIELSELLIIFGGEWTPNNFGSISILGLASWLSLILLFGWFIIVEVRFFCHSKKLLS
jgi:hypothetical protein